MGQELRICIDVPDVDAGVAFYAAAFGLRPGRRFRKSWVELLGGPCPIDLLGERAGSAPVPTEGVVRNYGRHWTPVHLDWPVQDLEAAIARAQAAGAKLEGGIRDRPYGRLAVLADPFGNGFCFLEFRGRGYDEMLSPEGS
jgi:predicted enzyme related to lactoylglutathione lyase